MIASHLPLLVCDLRRYLELFPYVGLWSWKYYCFEREEVSWVRALPCPITELGGVKLFDNLNDTAVVLSSTEAEDLEATSWMDWWTFVARSMTLSSSGDHHKVKRLIVARASCQLLVAKTASTMWANLLLMRHDTVLAKVKDNVSFEFFMNLRNSPLLNESELFPEDAVEKAIVKASQVLHGEAILKAVTIEKSSKKPMKWLQFPSQRSSLRHLSVLATTSRQSLGRGTSSESSSGSKPASFSDKRGGEMVLMVLYLSPCRRWEVFSGGIGLLGGLQELGIGLWRFSFRGTRFHSIISHLWHGNPWIPCLRLGVCQGSDTSGGSGWNAAERHSETGSPIQSGVLSSASFWFRRQWGSWGGGGATCD